METTHEYLSPSSPLVEQQPDSVQSQLAQIISTITATNLTTATTQAASFPGNLTNETPPTALTSNLLESGPLELATHTSTNNGTGPTNMSLLLGTTSNHEHDHSLFGHQDNGTTTSKLIASLVLFLITLLCGYLPVRTILSQKYIQHAMFAGGGVLMATAFCHLIPEVHDGYKESLLQSSALSATAGGSLLAAHADQEHLHQHNHQQTLVATNATPMPEQHGHSHAHTHSHSHNNNDSADGAHEDHLSSIPMVEVTICLGFFFMYILELIMVRFINNHTHEHPCDNSSSNGIADGRIVMIDSGGGEPMKRNNDAPNGPAQSSNYVQGAGPSPPSTGPNSTAGSASVGNLSAAPIMGPPARGLDGKQKSGFRSSGFDLNDSTSSNFANTGPATVTTEFYKFLRGLLIISAFGAHSIFDGVAIGSQDTVEGVWTIFFAISCHKLIIAAVVGLELFAATLESHLWTLVHLISFSIMSPIGIILVVVAQNSLNISPNDKTMILLQAFATGTLLYIIFIEILQPKKGEQRSSSTCFSLLAGFVLMLAILTFIGD